MFVLQLAGNRCNPRQMRRFVKPAAAILATVAVIVGAGIAGGILLGNSGSTADGPKRSQPQTSSTAVGGSNLHGEPTREAPQGGSAAADPLARAKAVLRAHGYRSVNDEQYASAVRLRALVGRNASTPPRERVFFFLGDDRWLGFDARDPSGHVEIVHQDGSVVDVAYALYRPGDSDADPSGGTKTVSFRWDGSRLKPLDAIPTSDPSAPLSRR